jgi:shikimate kinase
MPNKTIFLIGMPGSGKTTLGRKLSHFWSLPFFDLDQVIEKKLGLSIPEVFKTQGEEFFRQIEKEALSTLIHENMPPMVIAAGGGTPCFYQNLELMKNHGLVVFLNTPPGTILPRIRGNSSNLRPLLSDKSVAETKWKELWEARASIYHKAHLILDPTSLSFSEIARQIGEN